MRKEAMEVRQFYITFGAGTIFAPYYASVIATDAATVRAHFRKHYGNIVADVRRDKPSLIRISGDPLILQYEEAAHV